jgi:hypothetical protein
MAARPTRATPAAPTPGGATPFSSCTACRSNITLSDTLCDPAKRGTPDGLAAPTRERKVGKLVVGHGWYCHSSVASKLKIKNLLQQKQGNSGCSKKQKTAA